MKRIILGLALVFFLTGCEKEIIPDPEIELIGESEITIEVGSSYTELGALAIYDGNEVPVTILGELDTLTLGIYTMTYCVEIDDSCKSGIDRTVHVVDTTSPTLSLISTGNVKIAYGSDESFEDFIIAEDNYDTKDDLVFYFSKQINYDLIGSYRLYFYATDSSGNKSNTITCTVNIVDEISPILTLTNQTPLILEAGIDDLPLDYFSYSDNYDAAEDLKIFILDYSDLAIGTSIVEVYAKDTCGNLSVPVELTLTLTDSTAPVIAFSQLDDFRHEQGSEFTHDCLVLYDNFDEYEDITLVIEGEIDINTLGVYEMSYYAFDSNGNQSDTITKTVTVEERDDSLDYYERYMKDHTSLYDPVKFTNTYLYDPMEKCYRGLILNNKGGYDVAYFFFLFNYLNNEHVLRKIEFVNPAGSNIVHILQDDIHDYVFRIPVEFAAGSTSFLVYTYPHAENSATIEFWQGNFSFNNLNNLNPEYLLTLEFKPGNLK